MEQQRAVMEASVGLFPMADGVTSEPVRVGEMQAEWIIPSEVQNDAAILYLHGGGYCLGSINTHRSMVSFIAKAAKAKALIIDYRLAPENHFPAAVEDSVAAYRWLLAQGISAQRLIISGDSAGGGLTIATLVDLNQKKELLPAAAICLSPWVDMEAIGDSMIAKADVDPIVQKKGLLNMAKAYLATAIPRTPLASPIYADLKGLPPLLIQVGTAEILLDDATRLAELATQAGLNVSLESWDDMIHVWQLFVGMGIPESKDAIDGIAKFIQQHTSD
ncbi:MAG: alpha/beta hydrolase [Desulfobacteraceae bacterium]|nr:alpha/beta hydrolase [Desulfobacteraceae bacterium]